MTQGRTMTMAQARKIVRKPYPFFGWPVLMAMGASVAIVEK